MATQALRKSVAAVQASREGMLKATVIDARGRSNIAPYQDEQDHRFEGVGAIVPPYDPTVLMLLLEHSNALRQCIDAYVTNIDAFGHRFEPVVDLNAADADDRLTSYIMSRRMAKLPSVVGNPTEQVPLPTPEELKRAKDELAERMRAERIKLQHFFDFACLEYSFITLRRRTRQDLEQTGNAYWEVIRDTSGKVAGFTYVPGFTIRHMHEDRQGTTVDVKVKVNEFDYGEIETKRYFRRFVQVYETRTVFFKEFGDPRIMSALDGAIYPNLDHWKAHLNTRSNDVPATELMHFRVHTPKSSYGIPRWIGTILSVLGSRNAEEVNLTYFENKSVPPLAILVQGGRMTNESIERVKDFIDNEIKGKKNFHKILVLEADNAGASTGFDQGRMKIDLKPLTSAQHNDALFQNYDQANIDKIGMAFRLPRMLRGDIRDFNRATADAAMQFAEAQVFAPERDEFDFTINHKILPILGIRFWRFKSNASTATNPTDLTKMITDLTHEGVLVPAEARELAEKVFGRELRKLAEPWTTQPIQLTAAGIAPPPPAGPNAGKQPAAGGPGAPTGGTPLGGAAMAPTAPGTGGPGTASNAPAIAGSDMASVITINEARQSMGYGVLALASGEPDPDGYLTITEFKAKRMASGQVQGTAGAQAATGTDHTATSAGAAAPQNDNKRAPPTTKSDILALAADLMTLRKTMNDIEVAEIEEAFRSNLAKLKEAEAPENGGPIEG